MLTKFELPPADIAAIASNFKILSCYTDPPTELRNQYVAPYRMESGIKAYLYFCRFRSGDMEAGFSIAQSSPIAVEIYRLGTEQLKILYQNEMIATFPKVLLYATASLGYFLYRIMEIPPLVPRDDLPPFLIPSPEPVNGGVVINKPKWLADWLLSLNWDILGWHIYIGDAIESAIDWVIDWINYIAGLAYTAWNWTQDIWDRITEVYDTIVTFVSTELEKIWNSLSTLWDDIEEWFDSKLDLISDWFAAFRDEFSERLESFLTFEWLSDWWNNTKDSVLEWIDTVKENIMNWVEETLNPIREKINFFDEVISLVNEFLTNPVQFIWDKFLNWFLGEDNNE